LRFADIELSPLSKGRFADFELLPRARLRFTDFGFSPLAKLRFADFGVFASKRNCASLISGDGSTLPPASAIITSGQHWCFGVFSFYVWSMSGVRPSSSKHGDELHLI
jgi:hypothetical protein